MFINNILSLLNSVTNMQEGIIVVSSGKSALEIETIKTPKTIFFSWNSNNLQTCNADLDSISYSLTPTGFVVYTDVKSESIQIDWVAFFE